MRYIYSLHHGKYCNIEKFCDNLCLLFEEKKFEFASDYFPEIPINKNYKNDGIFT